METNPWMDRTVTFVAMDQEDSTCVWMKIKQKKEWMRDWAAGVLAWKELIPVLRTASTKITGRAELFLLLIYVWPMVSGVYNRINNVFEKKNGSY